jgi:hypothetical protein
MHTTAAMALPNLTQHQLREGCAAGEKPIVNNAADGNVRTSTTTGSLLGVSKTTSAGKCPH